MLATPRRQRGLNIIEIMIAIAIIGLLLTLAMPQYSIWLHNGQIRTTAEGVLTGLQFARAEAVSRNVTQGVRFSLVGGDWTVTVVSTGEVLRSQSGKERTENAVVVATPAGSDDVTFNGLGRVTAPANAVTVNVTNPTGGICVKDGGEIRCLSIVVSQNGAIRMCDPAKPVGDAQAC
jgi:type IV fimbrial biogenesis protein FimT